ncbi:hypothetical protein N781_10535 [Pontibacillus halophilus JSM 076056 = DSM 19796]|uniref:Prepilin-type N-terminal cleavage/methylation domain-containing protein n=1 Tax=Pontibacillus halophilus JSM 076056 = DSM 19796 TaxID=1385510 RepID=A0A0A5GK21_9BACI|nr:type II secretion system protein [Pontibacillus halophilus]KGX93621.1 hypothetical protein N781_10535 [Pontibacillus halophilus JSM 076056 = DSM 19796]
MKHLQNEKGVTLVELLAVMAMSILVVGVAYQILFSMFSSIDKSQANTMLRNEAAAIMLELDEIMLNLDEVETIPIDLNVNVPFDHFRVLDIRENSSGLPKTLSTEIEVANGELLVTYNGSSRTITDSSINASNTTFTLDKDGRLRVNLHIEDNASSETYTVFKIYEMENE